MRSRRDSEEAHLATMTTPAFSLFDDLRRELQESAELTALRDAVCVRGEPWTVRDGLIIRDGRVFLPALSAHLPNILRLAHTAGHEGVQKTLQRLRHDFHIEHDRRLVIDFVKACTVCQRNNTKALHPAGLLQPLPVPSRVWADVSMDFIEALPKVHGKSVILTVVDRFSKLAHFIPLGHPYTASSVARAFFNDIVRLHGLPESIVSDRDPVLTGHVWRDLFKMAGVQLRMSSAFHPKRTARARR